MGKHRRGLKYAVPQQVARAELFGRHTRAPWSLPVFAFLTSMTFILAPAVDPSAAHAMVSDSVGVVEAPAGEPQSIVVAEGQAQVPSRDPFKVTKVVNRAGAPAAGKPDPGSAKAIAYEMVLARGWGEDQYNCLVALWNRESGWNVYAHNKSSGAYGIPQALPGSKMATAGADWATSARTQITWGLGYITARYQTPCGAWASSQERGWY